jgi:hypothetical protein
MRDAIGLKPRLFLFDAFAECLLDPRPCECGGLAVDVLDARAIGARPYFPHLPPYVGRQVEKMKDVWQFVDFLKQQQRSPRRDIADPALQRFPVGNFNARGPTDLLSFMFSHAAKIGQDLLRKRYFGLLQSS